MEGVMGNNLAYNCAPYSSNGVNRGAGRVANKGTKLGVTPGNGSQSEFPSFLSTCIQKFQRDGSSIDYGRAAYFCGQSLHDAWYIRYVYGRGNESLGDTGSDGNRNGDTLPTSSFRENWYVDNRNMVKDDVE